MTAASPPNEESPHLLEYMVWYTRRFAPRAAYAARYACLGRKNSGKRTKRSACLIVRLGANWRLENAKSPAAMLQENNPDATRMSIPRMYLSGFLYLRCIYIIYVTKPVTAVQSFFCR